MAISKNFLWLNPSRCYFLIILLTFLLTLSGFAQSQVESSANNEGEDEVICTLNFSLNLVVVDVEVRNEFDEAVCGLERKDFIVYENGKRQDIQFFTSEKPIEEGGFLSTYTIGYFPPDKTRNDPLRKIRVKVRKAKTLRLKVVYWPEWYLYEKPK